MEKYRFAGLQSNEPELCLDTAALPCPPITCASLMLQGGGNESGPMWGLG